MKNFDFTIVASGFDPQGAYEDALFEAGCDDATVSLQKGVLILEFDRRAVSFSRAVATACRNVLDAGLKVERIEPDYLVSLAEIAERAKLSRQAITLYAKGERGHGFPPPAAKVTSKHPLWDWCEVAAWLHGKSQISMDEVVQARVVKEANTHISAVEIGCDNFLRRLEECKAA